MTENHAGAELVKLTHAVRRLESRLARIESQLGIPLLPEEPPAFPDAGDRSVPAERPEGGTLELSIGEFGLAWAGSVVFILGIVFLMSYAAAQGHALIAFTIGCLAAAGLYVLARVWSRAYHYLSRILVGASLLLAWYTMLRLHYFTAVPLVESRLAAVALILAVPAISLGLGLAARSQMLASLAVALGMISALLSGSAHVTLGLVALLSLLATCLALRTGWWRLYNFTIVLSYASHVVWLIGDPLAGRPLHAVAAREYPPAWLFLTAAVLAWPSVRFRREDTTDAARVGAVFLNCLGFAGVVSIAALAIYRDGFPSLFLAAAGLLLLASVMQWVKSRFQFAPATYACASYLALSVAIYGYARVPGAFLWLALQSFLVVSMALWYRSRTLVVVNAAISLGILAVYWATSPLSGLVNFGFALVAFGSARVMNWKKERLTLRTDGLRNVYLAITFVMVLFSLYHAVPGPFVALSWTLTSVLYLLMSVLLRNVKYRWMSLFTLLATVPYLFFVDLARLDPRFRVAAFLFLGLMAVAISLFYSRLRRLMNSGRS